MLLWSLWNSTRGMNSILSKDILSKLCFLMMVVASTVQHIGPKSPADVHLG